MGIKETGYEAQAGCIATPAGRLSYPYLIEANPKAVTKDGKPKWTTTLLLPPTADLSLLKKAAVAVVEEEFGSRIAKDPGFKAKLKSPFLSGEEKAGAEFKGWTVIRVSTTVRPGIVNASNLPVSDPEEVYAGRWASLLVRAGAYDVDGNRGVSFFLQGVQLQDHAERLAGVNVATAFQPVAETATGSVFD